MVSKGAVAGLALLATGVAAVVILSRAEEVTPAPGGLLSIEIQPIGGVFQDVLGQVTTFELGAVVTVTGTATEGEPLPNMVLELYDHGSLVNSSTQTGVTLNTAYNLVTTIQQIGGHVVDARMVLSNELGSVEYTTPSIQFRVGKKPKGDVTVMTEQMPL